MRRADDGLGRHIKKKDRADSRPPCDLSFVDGSTLLGLDSATGATRWELAPPNPESCILDGALTSSSEIVAVQCDGTVFGAAD